MYHFPLYCNLRVSEYQLIIYVLPRGVCAEFAVLWGICQPLTAFTNTVCELFYITREEFNAVIKVRLRLPSIPPSQVPQALFIIGW